MENKTKRKNDHNSTLCAHNCLFSLFKFNVHPYSEDM